MRDPGYPSRPLFNLDVGVACPPTFSVDFTIPTEGPDNYDKTLLVDITDSYRTIKVTIFRPAPNMTSEAYGKLHVVRGFQCCLADSDNGLACPTVCVFFCV